ncbi:hypothetical protein Pryu01_02142 [Paraliobacillus ryukyuensis]|uniref:Uncharacterized protein n=1 Tax=Paraliobacillus ryukyuensis TaxID=200904 RepID=A0A366E4V4_9BACI|nr:hypothetical protein DES48_10742 [Paraliobacillus ryukyuensis]
MKNIFSKITFIISFCALLLFSLYMILIENTNSNASYNVLIQSSGILILLSFITMIIALIKRETSLLKYFGVALILLFFLSFFIIGAFLLDEF